MDPRYCSQPISDVFSRPASLRRWMEVELATLSSQVSHQLIPSDPEAFAALLRISFTPDAIKFIDETEARLQHDLAAFVSAVPAMLIAHNPTHYAWAARYFHFGLTSSDIVDTSLSMAIQDATTPVTDAAYDLRYLVTESWIVHAELPTIGRTHGQPARSMTWGHRISGWGQLLLRAQARLDSAVSALRVGRLRGPLGDYSAYVTPDVESLALRHLNLRPAQHTTQVIPRDLHADLIYALASYASACDKIATDLRLLSIPELAELSPTPDRDYQGSSSMPHKVNPTSLERVSGLARLARSYVVTALDSVPLWLERDISHSSVERVVLPDLFHIVMQCISDLTAFFTDSFHPTGRSYPGPDTYERLHESILAGESRQSAHRHLSGRI